MQKNLDVADSSRGSGLFRKLKPKRLIDKHNGKLRRPLPGFKNEQGTWQYSREQLAIEWQAQFSRIENADATTMSALRAKTKLQQPKQPRTASFLKEIPTLYDLEKAVRTMSDSKAPGVDGVGAELLQMSLVPNVQKLYMLLLKTAIRGEAVVEGCGGWMIPLHKKGPQNDMANVRGILLEPVLARTFSKA